MKPLTPNQALVMHEVNSFELEFLAPTFGDLLLQTQLSRSVLGETLAELEQLVYLIEKGTWHTTAQGRVAYGKYEHTQDEN